MASWMDDEESGNTKSWANSLFSCGEDMTTFLFACLCPCYASGEIYTNNDSGGCCVGGLLCCCHGCLITGKVRDENQIAGSIVSDCLSCCFCYPCQLTRELREVRAVKDKNTAPLY
eukprot:90756_1